MFQPTFDRGHRVALSMYGLEKTAVSARLLGTLAGAGLGYAAAEPGEGMQGAVLGGLGGYGLGAGVSRVGQGIGALGAKAKGLLQRAPAATPTPKATPLPPAPVVDPRNGPIVAGPSSLPPQGRLPAASPMPQLPPASQSTMAGLPPGSPLPMLSARNQVIDAQVVKRGSDAAYATFGLKVADSGISFGLPGTPLSVGVSGKDVRYEGMRRFVPRGTFERAYEGLDQGLDPQALTELEQDRGTLVHPAIGAAAGVAAARKLFPGSGIPGAVLGGLVGGAGGALYNAGTADSRGQDMQEAVRGVLLEQNKLQQRRNAAVTGQPPATANESTPLLVSRGEVG